MTRPHARTRRDALATLLVAGGGLLALPGCDPRTMLFFLQPFDPVITAPGPALKNKKVVVLTQVQAGAGDTYNDLSRDLSREFIAAIRKDNKKKVQFVELDKITAWNEAHPKETDVTAAGKDFEADMVILFDVAKFQAMDPKSLELMEGTSEIHLHVWEFAHPKDSKGKEDKGEPKEWTQVYEEQADLTFPKRGAVPRDSGVSENAFKIKFLKLAAQELAWHFIDHAPEDDVQDVKFNASIQ